MSLKSNASPHCKTLKSKKSEGPLTECTEKDTEGIT